MKLIFKGRFDEKHFQKALNKLKDLIPELPENLEIYVLSNRQHCPSISRNMSKFQKSIFKQFCAKERISFSYVSGKKELIVIWITPDKRFLLKDADALAGLMAHEMMHTILRAKGFDEELVDSYYDGYESNYELLLNMNLPSRKFDKLFDSIGSESVMALKEFYANTELLKRGYGDYLLKYYLKKIAPKDFCPMPRFYDHKINSAKIHQLENAILFQLSLLSAHVPFQRYNHKSAKKLISHIDKCYEEHIEEVSDEFHDLIEYMLTKFKPGPRFNRRFFKKVFLKVYKLLMGTNHVRY